MTQFSAEQTQPIFLAHPTPSQPTEHNCLSGRSTVSDSVAARLDTVQLEAVASRGTYPRSMSLQAAGLKTLRASELPYPARSSIRTQPRLCDMKKNGFVTSADADSHHTATVSCQQQL